MDVEREKIIEQIVDERVAKLLKEKEREENKLTLGCKIIMAITSAMFIFFMCYVLMSALKVLYG